MQTICTPAEWLESCRAIVRGEADAFGRRFNSLPVSMRRRLLYVAGASARQRWQCRGVWFAERSLLWADLSAEQRTAVRGLARELAGLVGVAP